MGSGKYRATNEIKIMGKRSLIYRHIVLYRLLMNLLYLGKYKRRFASVIAHLKTLPPGSRILELCFGDIYIADFCRKAGYKWTGLDINEHFIFRARKLGFDARHADLSSPVRLPQADVCVMMGSLYHFHSKAEAIVATMFAAAPTVIISEPIYNLSSKAGLIGLLAKRSANTGEGDASFRYTRETLLHLIDRCRARLKAEAIFTQDQGKDLILKLIRNGNDNP